MKRLIAAATASVVLLSVASLAMAQPDDRRGPGARAAQQRPAVAPRAQPPAPRVQRPAITQPRQQIAPQRRAMPQQAQPRARIQLGPDARAVQERGRTRDRAAQPRLTPSVPRQVAPRQVIPRQADERRRQDGPGAVGRPRSRYDQPRIGERARSGPDRQPVSRANVSDEQRRIVRERLLRQRVQRVPRSRIGMPLSIGSHIPRHHRLHRLSPAILALAPPYSGYSYLVVDDTVCIVDPETYAIVDILPATFEQAQGPARPALALSGEQMRFIYANVPKDRARADLRIRLALGAEIPRGVDLFAFPEIVIGQVPLVEPYRYLVVENDVVIVDPADRSVVLVIPD